MSSFRNCILWILLPVDRGWIYQLGKPRIRVETKVVMKHEIATEDNVNGMDRRNSNKCREFQSR